MRSEPRQPPFCCPVCGCVKYVRVKERRRNGDWYRTEFWQCFGCSVMFRDPEKFTRNLVTGDGVDRSPRNSKRE